MSAFGGNSNMSNSNLDPPRNNQKHANGYGDPRRNGNITTKKKYTKPNGPFNNNGNGNNNTNNKRMGSNQDKKRNSAYIHNKKGGNRVTSNKQESNSLVQSDPLDIPTKVLPRQKPDMVQQYTPDEINSTGGLILNPEQFGFQRNHKSIAPRPIPKYLLHQPRLLVTPIFSQDAWDKQNQAKMLSMEEQNSGTDYQGLYEEFQRMRETERKQMETLGLVDAENISKDLTDAISFQGSCLDMCPIFERVRRALEKNVKALEKDPNTNKISRTRAIKAFSRPAAGQPPPLPSEVRPPHILKQTLDYLIENIVPQLPEAHSFIWDRTRSIRQDFTYQNFFGPEAIDCNERIVRIHLVSLHIMAGSDVEYSQQQELEQFNKALQTLVEIYQDVRNHGGRAPNEAEFRSYYLLSHLRDPELEREIQELPSDILENRQVQLALMFRNMVSQNNIVERGYNNSIGALNLFLEFFKIVYSHETPFLMSCLLETQFNEIRFYALKSMSRCYHTRGKAYSAESLQNFLGFDSLEKLIKFVQYYEIDILYDNGIALVDLFNKEKLETKYKLNSVHDKPKLAPPYSTQIDLHIQGKSLISFINCGESTYNLGLKQSEQLKIIELPNVNDPIPKQPIQPNLTGSSSNNNQFASMNKDPKSLSLTDFLSSSTNNNIVNKSVFLQTSNVQAKTGPLPNDFASPQISFGTNNNQISDMNVKPSFVFNAPNTKPEQIQKTPSPSAFTFGSSASSKALPSSNNKLTNSFAFNKDISSGTTHNFVGDKAPQIIETKTITKPIISKVTDTPVTSITPKPIETSKPMPKKLIDSPQFPRALNEVYFEILQNTVNSELHRLLPKLIRAENSCQERNKVIKSLSNELYQAFMSEIIYKTTLEVKADSFQRNWLKLKTIKKLIKIGSSLKTKHELKRKKIDELHETTFNNLSKKRKSSSTSLKSLTSSSSSKKRHVWDGDVSVDYIDEKQNEIRQLWKPIDLKQFIERCSRNLKMSIEMKEIELKFLLIVEDWSSPYSKWLNTKLSLKINKEKLIYENIVTNNKLVINFTSLPNNDYLNKDFFTNTSFVLFECGFVNESQVTKFGTIQDKLKRDQLVINKIISLGNKYSYYKMQILVVFWDIEQSKLTSNEVSDILNISTHLKNESVFNITLCDMTANETSINEVLLDAFSKCSSNFKGELTKRGLRKKERITKAKEAIHPQSLVKKKSITDDTFKAAENEALNKAKLSKKYQYLSKHLGSNTSLANASNNSNSTFMTANNITIPNLAYPMNSTFLNLNTTGNNTTMNNGNESILTGFGNGVLEESTPFSSPKAKPFTQPNVQNIPRKLQQLRDLTAGIKARYKKK